MAECRQGKRIYRSAGEARAALRGAKRAGRGADVSLFVYKCRFADHYHVSSHADIFAAHERPKVTEKAEPILSSAKLRRKLANAAAQIAAHQRRLDAADEARAKAEEAYRKAVAASAEEREWLAREMNRLFGSRP